MDKSFEERKKRRMQSYGACLIINNETRIIKEPQKNNKSNLSMLEELRQIFYPQLKEGITMNKKHVVIIKP